MGTRNLSGKCPSSMKVWAHKLGKVILMLKNLCKKQEVGLVYPKTK
jgi:hypothetical protein